MKFEMKKIAALAVAGILSVGVAGITFSPVTEAAHHQEQAFDDGTSNEFSHRMNEENKLHEQNVRYIRYQYRKDGDQKQYDRDLKNEQKRHDKVMQDIKDDYDAHVRHQHRK